VVAWEKVQRDHFILVTWEFLIWSIEYMIWNHRSSVRSEGSIFIFVPDYSFLFYYKDTQLFVCRNKNKIGIYVYALDITVEYAQLDGGEGNTIKDA
jgi:hypothetical protein